MGATWSCFFDEQNYCTFPVEKAGCMMLPKHEALNVREKELSSNQHSRPPASGIGCPAKQPVGFTLTSLSEVMNVERHWSGEERLVRCFFFIFFATKTTSAQNHWFFLGKTSDVFLYLHQIGWEILKCSFFPDLDHLGKKPRVQTQGNYFDQISFSKAFWGVWR